MNRWLMAVVMGLTVAGCAYGVEDPLPAPPPDPHQKHPPVQTFGEEVETITPTERLGLGARAPEAPELPNVRDVGPLPGQE